MSDWNYLNRFRVRDGAFGTSESAGWNGYFCLEHQAQKLKVISSDGAGWQHVSVSLADRPERTPNWFTMCWVKDLFFEPEDVVVQFHPAKSDYVNHHPGCLHLWRCTAQPFPTPHAFMVGPKVEQTTCTHPPGDRRIVCFECGHSEPLERL